MICAISSLQKGGVACSLRTLGLSSKGGLRLLNVPHSPPEAQTDKNALYWYNKKDSLMGKLVEGLDNRSKVVCV